VETLSEGAAVRGSCEGARAGRLGAAGWTPYALCRSAGFPPLRGNEHDMCAQWACAGTEFRWYRESSLSP